MCWLVQTALVDRPADPERLQRQYSDSEGLRIRQEAHRLYGQYGGSFHEWVVKHMDVHDGMTVVDVGCGYGSYHPLLRRDGARVVGMDRSMGMVREAADGCLAMVADAQDLPLPDACADRVGCHHMLYHVPDQAKAMRELRRIAKPGGRVVMATNGVESLSRLYEVAGQAAVEVGRDIPMRPRLPFALEDVDRVREVFRNATVEVIASSFVFPSAEPAVRYWRSLRDEPEVATVMHRMIDEIVRVEGSFRVPMVIGCFIADI